MTSRRARRWLVAAIAVAGGGFLYLFYTLLK